jgi:site-specific DNA-methyltransferase (adenine-specific)
MGSRRRKPGKPQGGGGRKGAGRSPKVRLLEGDCLEVLGELEPESVDAIVTDPPYGLEFMGNEWDRFRVDDPGTARHRGEHAGSHGRVTPGNGDHPARRHVAYGGGKRPTTCRCVGCGKRDQFRNSHEPCGVGEWRKELIDPHAAPPTSLAFGEWCRTWALEAKRVLKPGGHLLAFGSTRTYHRLACAIEDAGFEIRDSVMWLYGSGFPKSHNVSKAIAKTSPEVIDWDGWGTALKPAHEPIVVARKPLAGTVAENVLEHGCGALNIDGCRIGASEGRDRDGESSADRRYTGKGSTNFAFRPGQCGGDAAGRWPSNVVFSHREDCEPRNCAPGCPVVELDAQSGMLKSGRLPIGTRRKGLGYRGGPGAPVRNDFPANVGAASRFFYCSKPSRAERDVGLEGFVVHDTGERSNSGIGARRREEGGSKRANFHPTVKPIDIKRQLVRLVTPPGGVVLDPFLGSGSTGCGAVLEGFNFIGIERDTEYLAIAKARIKFWARHEGREVKEVIRRHVKDPREPETRTGGG